MTRGPIEVTVGTESRTELWDVSGTFQYSCAATDFVSSFINSYFILFY
jgi:hypothetical protein